ncbi:hypothetical protein CFOL_v3_05392 [Cephalotus follicularis]|uniref:Uncharacterized protein n=1 Tax=Cephalotus follicularis TaxID=3775 RepID=A0A1Q3B1H3_CEPFO|nr:hypothetical protein CFOL_v3_05392 [Cephalotus follicularis]
MQSSVTRLAFLKLQRVHGKLRILFLQSSVGIGSVSTCRLRNLRFVCYPLDAYTSSGITYPWITLFKNIIIAKGFAILNRGKILWCNRVLSLCVVGLVGVMYSLH